MTATWSATRAALQNAHVEVDVRRLLLGAVVVSLVATAAIAIATLLAGDFGETEGRVLLTTASISFFGLLSLAPGVLLEQGRLRPLALAGLALAGLGFVLALNLIWLQWDDAEDWSWKSLVVVVAAALAATQASGVESRRRDGDGPWVRRLALASHSSVAATAALVSIAALWEVDDDGYYRALGAVAVANVLLVALQPVLRRGGTQPAGQRLAIVLESGSRVEREVRARDFAAAVERAIRDVERSGERVVRVERR
jgi:peptidoglycan/LPS O-acetylase OafA/YrhL